MMMTVPAVGHVMVVTVRMSDSMGMGRTVVGVDEGVLMRMDVIAYQSIGYNECGPRYHHHQSREIHP